MLPMQQNLQESTHVYKGGKTIFDIAVPPACKHISRDSLKCQLYKDSKIDMGASKSNIV